MSRLPQLMSHLLDTLFVLIGVATLVFLLIHLVPGDPVDVMLGEFARPADKEELRQRLGLTQPVSHQLLGYFSGLLSLDLGESIHFRQPVFDLLADHFPATLWLTITAFCFSLIIAFPLGISAAQHAGQWQDSLASGISVAGLSIPNFWLGPLLVLLFSIGLGLTPVSGMRGVSSIILPALTLGASLSAISMRMVRATLIEVLQEDYIRTARGKGVSQQGIIWRHAIPNAMLPVLTLLGLQLGGLLAGAVVTETVFSWPGIGSLMIESIQRRDYPLVQGCVLLVAISYVLLNRLTDLLYGVVDPRIRTRI